MKTMNDKSAKDEDKRRSDSKSGKTQERATKKSPSKK